MRKITRIFAFISALLMMLTADSCSFKGKDGYSKKVHKGGYTEETVDLGINISQDSYYPILTEFSQKTDGISFLNISNSMLYLSAEGEDTFHGQTEDKIKDKIPIQGSFSSALSPQGDYYFCQYDQRSDGFTGVYISSDGSHNKIDSEDQIDSAEFTPDNRLFTVGNQHVYEVSRANYSMKAVFDVGYNVFAFDIIGDNLVVVDETGVKMYDYKNNKEVQAPEVLNNFFKSFTISGDDTADICCDEKNNMYILTQDGIFRYAVNGNQIEKILDGTKYEIGNPDNEVNSIAYCDDGSFYVSFKNGLMVKYRFDPELVNEKTSVLKIYSLEKNATLSQVVRDFSDKNKKTEIDYQIGMRSGLTYEDVLKNLTIQILSGNAPDVMMLDGVDIDNFVDKNLLYDLSASEDQWNKDSKVLDNIAKWNREDKKIYSVACRFRFPAIGAGEKEINNIHDYSDIADYVEKIRKDSNPDYPILNIFNPQMVISNALNLEGNDLISGGTIDRERMKEFYQNCSRVYLNDQPAGKMLSIVYFMSSCPDYNYDGDSIGNRLLNAIADPGVMAFGTVNSFTNDVNIATSIDGYKKNPGISFRYGINNENKLFVPECNLGIIENGKNKDEAVKFIAEALSSETQKSDHLDGLPVNTDTLDFFYAKNKDSSNNENTDIYHYSTQKQDNFNIQWMSDDEVKEFDSYIRSLNDPVYIDGVTSGIIIDDGIKCLQGNISAEEAANNTVSKLELKMKE